MTLRRWNSLTLLLAANLVMTPWSRADGPAAPDSLKVIAAYVAAAQKDSGLSAEQKRKIDVAAVAAAKDPTQAADLITSSLAELHPDFAAALVALANEQTDRAMPMLEKLGASTDLYLAAHAGFFQARALLDQEAYDQALPLLSAYAPGGKYFDRTTYGGEVLFMRGVCERRLLKRAEAIKSFTDFLDAYPQAAERLRLGANQHLLELKSMKDLSLDDVDDRMTGFSRNRLAREKSDKDITQAEQKRIVEILEKLIKEQEEKEKQQGQGSGGKGGKSGKSRGKGGPKGSQAGNPAEKSVAPVGAAKVGNLHDIRRGNPDDTWGADKERQRQEVLDALKSRFPERYRELLKEYYQNMTDEKDGG